MFLGKRIHSPVLQRRDINLGNDKTPGRLRPLSKTGAKWEKGRKRPCLLYFYGFDNPNPPTGGLG